MYDLDKGYGSIESSSDTVESASFKSTGAPPNAPEGGVWGVLRYNGERSKKRNRAGLALLVVPGLIMMASPKDKKDAYAVWEKVRIGRLSFIQTRNIYNRTEQ